jgi:carbonic anhydrase/acetyltransferase-like protein (isoleucine patch superfamily)
MMMNRIPYHGIYPKLAPSVYVAQGAQLIGDLTIDEASSVWFNAVVRADLAPIRIGRQTNLQDGVIAHVNTDQPLLVGHHVSVGHGAIIHGCEIADGCLIGMGAIILNGARIEQNVLLAAGSLVAENTVIPPFTLALGTPAKVVRELTERDLQRMQRTAQRYVQKAAEFKLQAEGGDLSEV